MEKFKENHRCVLFINIQLKLLPSFEQDPHLEIKIKSQKYIYRPGAFRGEDSNLTDHSEDYGSFPNSLKLCVLDRLIFIILFIRLNNVPYICSLLFISGISRNAFSFIYVIIFLLK